MTQIDKKVDWCLNKAKRELAENKLHRGLLQFPPNQEQARKHLVKAQHNLNAALFFDEHGYSDWSASAFFYCLYHYLLAILRKHGYESRNQECTFAVIEMLRKDGIIEIQEEHLQMLLISKAKETDFSLIQNRENFQYGVDINYTNRNLFNASITACKTLLDRSQQIVG